MQNFISGFMVNLFLIIYVLISGHPDLIKFISLVNNARVGSCCGLNYNPCHVIFEEASYTELVEFYKFFPKEQKEKIPEMFKIY